MYSGAEMIKIRTTKKQEIIDITGMVRDAIDIKDGICIVFCPHTTAGVFINENYDPSVKEDIIRTLEKLVPSDGEYTHTEGNADAHIKATILGSSVTLIVENGEPVLGTWQGVFFAEFDGPREREVVVKCLKSV